MPTIGVVSDQASAEIPSFHLDLIECPPVAASRRSCEDLERAVEPSAFTQREVGVFDDRRVPPLIRILEARGA